MSPWSSGRKVSWERNTQHLSPTFSFAAFFVSESIQLTYLRLSSNAHLISATMSSAWSTKETEESYTHISCTQQEQLSDGKDFEALTMVLLSSAKVALTNMAPRAKPRALSVSLTHSFQRGVQLCNIKSTHQDVLRKNTSSLTMLDNINLFGMWIFLSVSHYVQPISSASTSHFLHFPEWIMWVELYV